VHVDLITPTLKAPGMKLSKLKYDEMLSSFAVKFNLRRYDMVLDGKAARARDSKVTWMTVFALYGPDTVGPGRHRLPRMLAELS